MLHKAQLSILYTLRHTQDARFSELMKPTGLESDVFKFHIRKLDAQGLIAKTPQRTYCLTPAGKEFANNLDETKAAPQKQAKVSVLVVASRDQGGIQEYLCHQRLRNPYFGYWSCVSGPVRWGETPQEAAARELYKQTGLQAEFEIKAFLQQRDYLVSKERLQEDKYFIVVQARNLAGDLQKDWPHGRSTWMSIDQYKRQDRHLVSLLHALELIRAGQVYTAADAVYQTDGY